MAEYHVTCRPDSGKSVSTLFVALSSSENAHRAFFRVGNADIYDIAVAENSFCRKRFFYVTKNQLQ